jgi:hypothetical protein
LLVPDFLHPSVQACQVLEMFLFLMTTVELF